MKNIVFAGGCFWGVEAYFNLIDGVQKTTVGYANGHKDDPTYEEVCSKTTGHAEACYIEYDESRLSLKKLLEAFFRIIDPTVKDRQGPDVGPQYRTGIYYSDETDLVYIEETINVEQKKYDVPIVTEVEVLRKYFNAETYHQDYLIKNPSGYCHIPLNALKKELGKS